MAICLSGLMHDVALQILHAVNAFAEMQVLFIYPLANRLLQQ